MRLVLFGAPGSGKGTQAPFLGERFHIPTVSTGEILRDNARRGTDLGVVAEGYMSAGELVPDDVTIKIIRERIKERDAENGFILDGFPRTIPQAEALDQMLEAEGAPLDRVIFLNVPEDTLEKRLGGRWTCPCCGRVYSSAVPEAKKGYCDDDTTVELVQREDDKPEAVKNRIRVYHEETLPVLDYYRTQGRVLEINGDQSPDEIRDELFRRLEDGGEDSSPEKRSA
ncbi:MAG: adenylate kinase [Candidatus Dormiibacterota bacterium]